MHHSIQITLPEAWRVGWPVMNKVLQRIAMKPQVVPPTSDLLRVDVEACREPGFFHRIAGVAPHPLALGQLEELLGDMQHPLDHRFRDSVVLHLKSIRSYLS
ncbi:protein DMR6-LIKE OXYGENASE 2-like [Iris pallida]|uniref:Protein DMR6-LIKE OXYGENASE 2-like n=1 Tax=Iris pallida TaxID=29817 RepID=A0AAX6EB20_IRIPA|nr:protein DMR6-LIKE OXYGENASE 2-like [Iris pallida]